MANENGSVIPPRIENRRIEQPTIPVRSTRSVLSELKVACILDNLSMSSFAPEADFQPLTMRDWLVELTASQPDLLFVESAWRGHRNSWWNEVQRCGPELLGILEWCESRGVPTVFWNKEDPVHFSTFLSTAKLFDVVFTTDVDCVPRYKAALGHEDVYFLPFAAQPAYHNPLEEFERVGGCSFAGAYYKKYAERNKDFNELSGALKETGSLDIYDRNFGTSDVDQQFPAEILDLVVGGLSPEDISVAYKGYTYSLNLNSVKESQSMFARRAFELIASNTAVISNYARGLRVVFGDLVFTTDSADQLRSRLRWVREQPNGIERLRTMGLRKVLDEHTYAKRLEEVARRAGIKAVYPGPEKVLLLCRATSVGGAKRIVKLMQQQTHEDWELWLISDVVEKSCFGDSRIHVAGSNQVPDADDRNRFDYVGALEESSWYGEQYLADLLRVFTWADVNAVGHVERYIVAGGKVERIHEGACWRHRPDLQLGRSIVKNDGQIDFSIDQLNTNLRVTGVAVSTLEYCENFSGALSELPAEVLSLDIDQGFSLREMQDYAASLDPRAELEASGLGGGIKPADLFENLQSVTGLEISIDQGRIKIDSSLASDQHQYAYSRIPLDPFMLPAVNGGEVYFESTPGLNVMLAFVYYSDAGERIGHTMIGASRNTPVSWPEETVSVKVGIRVLGTGSGVVMTYSRSPRNSALHPPISLSKSMIVTNRYPSYDALYQNGFIASRAEAYRDAGNKLEIFCLEPSRSDIGYREFNGIDVTSGNENHLEVVAEKQNCEHFLVHFLSPEIWSILSKTSIHQKITVWVHGFEAQPWWRRKSLYVDPESQQRAISVSEERMRFWRDVFTSCSENWHFVFVSHYLADQVFEDVGVKLDEAKYSVISNVIDCDLFGYHGKAIEQRFKVLSIRPYASAIYANDLAVKAVLELRESSPYFEKFEFAFYGDGILFEETLAPLEGLDNVLIKRGFLTRQEIAKVHQDYGVFLVPSRMDTQGVSRGEAMASGLVPVSNAVAAIPEFVDEHSGMLADSEDAVGLAKALHTLAEDAETFAHLSEGAARRIREQLGFDETIGAEMRLVGFVEPQVGNRSNSSDSAS